MKEEVKEEKTPENKEEVKEQKLEENTATPTEKPAEKPVEPEKKKKKKYLWLIILIILLLIGGGAFYWFKMRGTSSKTSLSKAQEDFKGPLKAVDPQTDEGKKLSKTLTSTGGVMQVEASDGTLYTLTVPEDALILPSTIEMTPLTSSSVENYGTPAAGYGVLLGGKFSFIRPTYLTVQPKTKKPTEKVKANICSVGSRIYNPEICAGMAGIPFASGVVPGQVVVDSSKKKDNVLLTPTIYTGMKNTWNAMLWYPGSYFADTINKPKAASLAKVTFDGANDYVNQTEVLMHLADLGGDLTPYKEEIKRFVHQKDDYPREVLKGALIGLAIKDQEVFKARSQDYYGIYTRKFKDVRSSFIPWPRYASTYRQILAMNRPQYKTVKKAYFWQSQKVWAIQDWEDIPPESSGSNHADSLPNYDGDNGVDYGDSANNTTSWDDIINSLFPPDPGGGGNIRDWSDVARDDQLGRDTDDIIEDGARATLDKSHATACEKAEAIQTLIALNRVKTSELERFMGIVEDCANKCTTMEECEGMGDIGDRWGSSAITNAANTQIMVLLQNAKDCNLGKKKGLADYGQNTCETE